MQLCDLFRLRGDSGKALTKAGRFVSPRFAFEAALTKSGRADAYEKLPLAKAGELPAAASRQNPKGKTTYGCAPRTRPFGSTAAVRHYNCFSRATASRACGYLKIPRIGCCDDLGIVAPGAVANVAVQAFARSNGGLAVMLKKNISGAYSVMDCLGLAIGVRDECDDFIASLKGRN